MTLQQLHEILKSRPFKLTNYKNETSIFSFSGIYIHKKEDNTGKYLAEYDIEEKNGNFYIKFSNVKDDIWTGDFKNILLVSDNIRELLNYDGSELQQKGKIHTTLIGL